jgi:tetratricopeptide (TPR) repeat protein
VASVGHPTQEGVQYEAEIGRLRHSRFVALRDDKKPNDVRREAKEYLPIVLNSSWSAKGYGENMHVQEGDDDKEPPADAVASRARQWSRAALALALLFASLPVASKLFLNSWRFDGAIDVACLSLVAAAYLYFVGRDRRPQIPDSAAILDNALQLAAAGATARGLALLDEALRLDPGLWQAWEYRGQIHLGEPDGIESALRDFTEAIRLAPEETHLYTLRSHALTLLGQHSSARADLDVAARLAGDNNARLIP